MNLESSLSGSEGKFRAQYFRSSSQPSSDAQFALAGVLDSDVNPKLTVKQFPHRRLDSEEQEIINKSESENGKQNSRLRDDDRKGHLDVLLRATEQFLAQGEIAKAAKAFGIVLQLRPRAEAVDIRLHHLWTIGSEILMRQREQLQEIDQRLSAAGNGIPKGESRWGSSSNVSELKSYFEILIRQYAYDHKAPNKISAGDFWLALLSCELSTVYAEHLRGIAHLEAEARLRGPDFEAVDADLQYETKEDWMRNRGEAICQRTLTALRDINQRMEKLVDQLPYSKNESFLQLREITSLLSIDLLSIDASPSNPSIPRP